MKAVRVLSTASPMHILNVRARCGAVGGQRSAVAIFDQPPICVQPSYARRLLTGPLWQRRTCVDKLYRILSPSRREHTMGFSARDVVPFTQARANLSELAEQAKAGAEKIITKNGESYVALIDADRLDYYHRLERERIHLLLLEDARRGLDDIAAGRTQPADAAIASLQKRRAKTRG